MHHSEFTLTETEMVNFSSERVLYLEHGWPTDQCRRHRHAAYELHLITATSGTTIIGDYIGRFSPGSLYLVVPDQTHNWITDARSYAPVQKRDVLVQFNPSMIDNMLACDSDFQHLDSIFNSNVAGFQFHDFDLHAVEASFATLSQATGAWQIVELMRLFLDLHKNSKIEALSQISQGSVTDINRRAPVMDVVDFLKKNVADELSLGDAADMAGMSVATFTRKFQAATGQTFVTYVNELRVETACRYLFRTDLRVSDIAYEVGYQSLANFNRNFLNIKGVSPTEFRKTHKPSLS